MAVTSHKEVPGFAGLPSFIAGAVTGLCAFSLSVGICAKFIAEEWKTPIQVSFFDQIKFQEYQLASDPSIEQNLIKHSLVIRKKVYQLRRSVVVAKVIKPIVISRAAPIVVSPPVPKTKVTPQAVYSAYESSDVIHEYTNTFEPKLIQSTTSDDEYSKMMSLRNTFVASLIGDMTTQQSEPVPEIKITPEKLKEAPIINKVNKVLKVVPEKKIKKIAIIQKKKPIQRTIKIARVEPALDPVPVPNPLQDLLKVVEGQAKAQLNLPEYSNSLPNKIEPVVVNTQKLNFIKSKESAVETVIAQAKQQQDVAVVIEKPKVELIQPKEKVVLGDVVALPEPLPVVTTVQSAPEVQSVAHVEPKKEEVTPVVAWSISPALLQSLTTPKKQTEVVTITTRANNTGTEAQAQAVTPAPKPINLGNLVNLAHTTESVVQMPEPPVKPVCTVGICFERWLATQPETLNVLSFSLNHIPAKRESREWLITDEEKSLPVLYFGSNDGFVPLINRAEFEQTYKMSEEEGFLLVRNNPDWLVKSDQILKEVNSISYSKAPLDKLYTKLQPGMKLIEITHKETKEHSAVAVPVVRGHVTFLDLTQSIQQRVVIKTDVQSIEGQILNISWVGHNQETIYRTGKKIQSADLKTFGKYPIIADVKSVGGFSHRYLVFQKSNQSEMNLEILKDSQVERFLKMLEGGVSSESGMVFGKVPLSQIGSDLRIDPSRKSKTLIPELYYYNGSLNEEDQVLVPHVQANAKVRNFVGVQIPKGMLLLSLEKSSGDKTNIQLHLAQSGVINVYQPE